MSRVSVAARRHSATGGAVDVRPWIQFVARAGIGARGVIYVILAYLALDIALHGSSPVETSGEGALQEVAKQPASPVLLSVLTLGLVSYAIWRLVQTFTGKPSPRGRPDVLKRLGSLLIAGIYLGLSVRAVELVAGGSSGSSTSNPQPEAARVLGWPSGPEILGAIAAGLIIGGVALALWGFIHDYDRDLATERLGAGSRKTLKVLGSLGDLARGFLLALVGSYLLNAAVDANAAHAKSVDAALESLARRWYGPEVIGLLAAGLLCFGLFSFVDARLRSF